MQLNKIKHCYIDYEITNEFQVIFFKL